MSIIAEVAVSGRWLVPLVWIGIEVMLVQPIIVGSVMSLVLMMSWWRWWQLESIRIDMFLLILVAFGNTFLWKIFGIIMDEILDYIIQLKPEGSFTSWCKFAKLIKVIWVVLEGFINGNNKVIPVLHQSFF